MLYEMDGVTEELAREAFRLAAAKLPLKTDVHRASARRLRSNMMKASELHRERLRPRSTRSCRSLLKAQFGLRMQLATQQLTNTSQLKKVRRDIARVRTVLTEKAKQK